ncbi:LINE-1 retrotransposable element ORF2 protein [Linum grandiflorum]
MPQETPILDAVTSRINSSDNEQLCRPFTGEEVFSALRQVGSRKAPGADGMSILFFRKYWDIVGSEVIATVLGILDRGTMLPNLNYTLNALIPKVKSPESPKEFRPISLCNVYKLVAKVLANRLKLILDKEVSPEQSAFVPGRFIADNVMATFESFHSMKKISKAKTGYFAAKVDMAKAYDRVEWKFLECIMRRLNFDDWWIQRIMMCVETVSFSVLVNGRRSTCFTPSRGLRQGDPLSPYLFLLCAEGLSKTIHTAINVKHLHGLKVAVGAPVVSHLFFVDDSILFSRATVDESIVLRDILKKYERESRQLINFQKSEISFSRNVGWHTKLQISGVLGMKIVEKHDKYLGLVMEVGRSKKSLFCYLRDRVQNKLKGFAGKNLSPY